MSLIRILHVVTKMDTGGLETLIMNFYRNIDRSKIQFDFLTHRSEQGFYDEEIRNLGGYIYHVPPINPLKQQRYLNALRAFFEEHKEYKIVHSHINTNSIFPLRTAMHAEIPVRIAHSHAAYPAFDYKTPFRIYNKLKLKKYSTYNFACSDVAGKWLFGSDAVKKDNFKVINNSIDAENYSYNKEVRQKIREELNIKGKFVVGHVGRFNKSKNHDYLIDIFKLVHQKDPDAVLMLVGDGELRNSMEEKVNKLNLEDKTIFTGVQSNVNELLQAMDVFVLPSISEGLGIVAIEAQAAGIPCVVADTVPNEAFITDLIKKVPLNSSANGWANEVVRWKGFNKRDTFEIVKNAGYDIKETTKELEKFYIQSLT